MTENEQVDHRVVVDLLAGDALDGLDLTVARGEGHGFLKAETIQRTLEAELYFYSRVFGFPLAEKIDPVEIENLPPST